MYLNIEMIFKQTALCILCGLLSVSSFAQIRSKENISEAIEGLCERRFFDKNTDDFKLKTKSSNLFGDEQQDEGEAFYLYASEKEDGGFILVSGDKRMPAVLAYSEEETFDVDNIPPNVRYWLSCYVEHFQQLKQGTFNEPNIQEFDVISGEVSPLLGNIKWGQDTPYNNLCPAVGMRRTLSGCVATGMAQIMKFHQYPEVASGTIQYITRTNRIHISEDLSQRSFDWGNMRNAYNRSYTQTQAEAVAQLMYCCGVAVEMDYNLDTEGGSGAYQSDLVRAYIRNFGYDKDAAYLMRSQCATKDWHRIMMNELNAGRPINYAGQSLSSGGHSFVIDGYRMSEENSNPDYHVNWGWEGQCDGYYQIIDLTPTEGGLQGTTDGFNVSQEMVIGIQPEDGISQAGSYIVASDIQLSSSSVKTGKSATLTIGSCTNMSYQRFSGSLNAVLLSTVDSTEYLVGSKEQISMTFLDEHTELDIKMYIPDSIPEGKYNVELRSVDTTSGNTNKLIVKNRITINVSEGTNEEEETPEKDEDSFTLGCSELELRNNQDSLKIQVNLYELINLKEKTFTGYVRMILADNAGNAITVFGDSVLLEEMSYKEVQSRHKSLKGCLVGDIPDGKYRLYIGVRRMNESEYNYMALFDWTVWGEIPRELYLKVEIKDGVVYIKDNAYKVIPTLIRPVLKDSAKMNGYFEVYTPNGTFIGHKEISELDNLPSGVYILRNKDGVRKMVR